MRNDAQSQKTKSFYEEKLPPHHQHESSHEVTILFRFYGKSKVGKTLHDLMHKGGQPEMR